MREMQRLMGKQEIDWLTGMEKEATPGKRKRIDFEGQIKQFGGGEEGRLRCTHR